VLMGRGISVEIIVREYQRRRLRSKVKRCTQCLRKFVNWTDYVCGHRSRKIVQSWPSNFNPAEPQNAGFLGEKLDNFIE
jgi:hypothetical protein